MQMKKELCLKFGKIFRIPFLRLSPCRPATSLFVHLAGQETGYTWGFSFHKCLFFLQAGWWELVWCPNLIFVSGDTWCLSSHKWWAMVFDFGIIHTESIEMIILSMVRDDKRRRKKLSPMSIPHVTCWVLHSWLIFVFSMVYVFVFDTVYGFVFGMVCFCLFFWQAWWRDHTSYLSRKPREFSCNFFLAGVNFYRFNAKHWQFTVYFAVITQKRAIYCVFCRNLYVFSV